VASGGGGIANDFGSVTITNTTISGNTVSNSGGGIQTVDGTTVMNNLTIANNTAVNQGGGFNGNSNFTIANSIIAGNTVAGQEADCFSGGSASPGVSLGYNLIQDPTGCTLTGNTATNITGVDPMLGPLTSKVMALLPGSPALNAGSPSSPGSGGSSCAIIDQRGIFRPQGTRCDIGAFEATPGLFISSIFPAQGGSGGVVTVLIGQWNPQRSYSAIAAFWPALYRCIPSCRRSRSGLHRRHIQFERGRARNLGRGGHKSGYHDGEVGRRIHHRRVPVAPTLH
jgi:hypothetical protein